MQNRWVLAEEEMLRAVQASQELEADFVFCIPEPDAAGGQRQSCEDTGSLSGESESVTLFLPSQSFKVQNLHSVPWGLGSVTRASGLKYFRSGENRQVQIPEGFLLGLASF